MSTKIRFFRHPETVSGSEVNDDFLSACDDERDEWPSEEDALEQSPETGHFPHDA